MSKRWRRYLFRMALAGLCLLILGLKNGGTQGPFDADSCFYLRSLHFTAAGMKYWYSAENGGLERLTGIDYEQLGCKNCHAATCDRCHRSVRGEGDCAPLTYSKKAAAQQGLCLECHGREKAMIRINHKAGQEDVHVAQGMVCMDCHSHTDLHGNGTRYVSMKAPGAMNTACEDCHDSEPTEAHTVHEGKLDCKACHIRHVVSCTNCHFDTMVEKGVRKAIPVSGWMFLMNLDGKVTSASMQTFVTGENKTFLMFAPHMSHAVMKDGRSCGDCHATNIVRDARNGRVELTWLEKGAVVNRKGVIPVADSVQYGCSYQHFVDGHWVPISNPLEPLRQYAAFGKPLSREQLEKMAKAQAPPEPKMQ